MGRVTCGALLVLFFCGISLSQLEETNPVVQTANGKIRGRLEHTPHGKKAYYVFQGIPFAQPPVNELRFRAPVPANNWEGILETTRDASKCMQLGKGAEDCLYINVFTPAHKKSSLPVMVWIYGGYFFKGDSGENNFGPDYFMEEDIIIVTFNYRLGIFGYLSTDDEASPGNYGLKDQILALKWVQANIVNFGGDPKQVTLFGESAGSVSVSYLLQTRLTSGLFSRAIMQSGTSICPWAISRYPRLTTNLVASRLDIDSDNSTIMVEALRRVDAKLLERTSESTDLLVSILENPLDTIIFGPAIEPKIEGAVFTSKSHHKLKHGGLHKIPIMLGFNSEEGLFLDEVVELIRPFLISFDFFRTSLVPLDMNIKSTMQKMVVALAINRRYFGPLSMGFSDQEIIRFITDHMFVRPIYEYVNLVSKYNPVYFYKFSYEGNIAVNGTTREYKGVAHAEELLYFWKNREYTVTPVPDDLLTRTRVIKLWTNFAKFGNPTPEPTELFNHVLWPLSGHRNITYFNIGKNITLGQNLDFYNVPFWISLYKKYGNPPYDTF